VKRLHRKDLWCWSNFNQRLNVDFHGFAWARADGCVLIDPVVLSEHDLAHLAALGGVSAIIVTNKDHVRATEPAAAHFKAPVWGPAAERESFPIPCQRWLADGDEPLPGLRVLALDGSKTPGELALLLDETTLITGDLVRAHRAGALMLLMPEQGLKAPAAAAASVRRLAALPRVEAVLVGDGWCLFENGRAHLGRLADSLAPS
jgi:glyoxylase-like metal-dependent hydrolase (beta-lactamase superfamily II)